MTKGLIALLLIFLMLVNLGCVALVAGTAIGAVGAYAVSKDTIQGDTDKSYDSLWNASLSVSKIRGTIKQEDPLRGYIELETDTGRVWIRVIRLTRATTRLRVSARRLHFPHINLASDIFVKIMEAAR
ncbi:MAG: DUF3568 domain-containing protein [Candidatus Omnitrophica bacterium]|nr:DUF3568 domain-containing protein [Candidatus Omnitrophota bacterium]